MSFSVTREQQHDNVLGRWPRQHLHCHHDHVVAHPEVEGKVFGDAPRVVVARPFMWDLLEELFCCTPVMRENLRLFPVAPLFVKNSPPERETTLGMHRTPSGSLPPPSPCSTAQVFVRIPAPSSPSVGRARRHPSDRPTRDCPSVMEAYLHRLAAVRHRAARVPLSGQPHASPVRRPCRRCPLVGATWPQAPLPWESVGSCPERGCACHAVRDRSASASRVRIASANGTAQRPRARWGYGDNSSLASSVSKWRRHRHAIAPVVECTASSSSTDRNACASVGVHRTSSCGSSSRGGVHRTLPLVY